MFDQSPQLTSQEYQKQYKGNGTIEAEQSKIFIIKLINYCLRHKLNDKFNVKYIAQHLPIYQLDQWSRVFAKKTTKNLKHNGQDNYDSQPQIKKDILNHKSDQQLHQNQQISLQQFIALMCSSLPHRRQQTLFLIVSLTSIYHDMLIKNKIKNTLKGQLFKKTLKYAQITQYLCQKISNVSLNQQNVKLHGRASSQSVNQCQIKNQNIQNYASISHVYPQCMPYLSKETTKIDKCFKSPISSISWGNIKTLNQKKDVMKVNLNYDENKNSDSVLIVLVQNSNKIQIFDHNLILKYNLQLRNSLICSSGWRKKGSIKQKTKKQRIQTQTNAINQKHQRCIKSCAFSTRQQKIGCLINQGGLVFWQHNRKNGFQSQILIQNIKGDKIYYFQSFNHWGIQKKNTLSILDIENSCPACEIKLSDLSIITAITEIYTLRSLVISVNNTTSRCLQMYQITLKQNNLDDSKSYQNILCSRLLSTIQIDKFGCHTLIYNELTCSIICLNYSSLMRIYEHDNLTYEISLLGQLVGHRSIVTAGENIKNTSIFVSGDDQGQIKLWNLKFLRCFQSISIGSEQIRYIKQNDSMLIVADHRITQLKLQQKTQEITSDIYIAHFIDSLNHKIYIFSSNSCSRINADTGTLQKIYLISKQDEFQQVTAVQNVGLMFYIGTNRGQLIITDNQFKRKKVQKIYQNQIASIRNISENKITRQLCQVSDGIQHLLIKGDDTQGFSVWIANVDTQCLAVCKKIVIGDIGFNKNQSFKIQICLASDLVALQTSPNELCLLKFNNLFLQQKLVFPSNISCFKFHPQQQALLVSLFPSSFTQIGSESSSIYMILFNVTKQQKQQIEVQAIVKLSFYKIFKYSENCQKIQSKDKSRGRRNGDKKLINGQQSSHIKEMIITNSGLVTLNSLGFLQIHDIKSVIQELNASIDKNKIFSVPQNTVYMLPKLMKAVEQSMQNILMHSQNKAGIDVVNTKSHSKQNKVVQLISSRSDINYGSAKSIIKIQQIKQSNRIAILYNQGDIFILDLPKLKTVCIRRSNELTPTLWTAQPINQNIFKIRIVEALKLVEKIHKMNFRQNILKYVCMEKIDVTKFLQQLACGAYNIQLISGSNQALESLTLQHKTDYGKNKLCSQTSSQQKEQNLIRLKKHSKQNRKKSCFQKVNPNFKSSLMARKLSQAALVLQNREVNPLKDPFFRASIKDRLSENQFQIEPECMLFNKINDKIQKWKLAKNRQVSLTNYNSSGVEGQSKPATTKNIEKNQCVSRKSNRKQSSKHLLHQKIQRIFGKKDRRLQLVRKIFKKDYQKLLKQKK